MAHEGCNGCGNRRKIEGGNPNRKKISACQIFHPSWSYRCVRACDWKVCLCAVAGFWWNIFSEKYTLTQKKMSSRDPEQFILLKKKEKCAGVLRISISQLDKKTTKTYAEFWN